MRTKLAQKGFAHLDLLAAPIVVLIILLVGFYVVSHQQKAATAKSNDNSSITFGAKADPNTANQKATTKSDGSVYSQPSAAQDPSVTITKPAQGETITEDTFIFSCSTSTPAGFSKVVVVGKYNGFEYGNYTFNDENTCQGSLDVSNAPNGTYTVTATVYDKAGKTAFATHTFKLQH